MKAKSSDDDPLRKCVVFLADAHGGHKLGLMNPRVVLHDIDYKGNLTPWTPRPTATQKYLDKAYSQDRESVIQLAGDDPIVVVHAGDLTQGNAFKNQLVSTRMADQISIAVANLRPWCELPNVMAVRLLEGTGVHVFGENSAAILVCDQLRALYPHIDIKTLSHAEFTVQPGNVRLDVAHHGPGAGSRKWLEGNILRYYLVDILLTHQADGTPPPHWVFRAHYHRWKHETVRVEGIRDTVADIVLLPSYCWLDEHARKVTRSVPLVTHGLCVLECTGDGQKLHAFKRTVDLRTKEVL